MFRLEYQILILIDSQMSGKTIAMPIPVLSTKATLPLRPPSTTLLPTFSSSLTMFSSSLVACGCPYANFIGSRETAARENSYGSALKPSPLNSSISASCSAVDVNEPWIPHNSTQEENEAVQAKIGAKVRVKVPLRVYHVPKVPELDLTGMEGQLKQYVAIWKGKTISANLPYKVEFITHVEGRGPVKFFAHLKEGEFEYV